LPVAEKKSTVIRALAAIAFLLLLTGCGSMNVVSDGADSNLMLKGYDPVAYYKTNKELAAEYEKRTGKPPA
jgi:hypothetical protein